MKDNIILTGFMGTGKTTIGKLLAAQLGYQFVDTDALIEAQQGRTIPEIFHESGEAAFRQMEADLARELADQAGLVISTGGRMLLDPHNEDALSRQGRIFCLTATPSEILTRLQMDTQHPRPLLAGPDPAGRLGELFRERQEGYQRFTQVKTSGKEPAEVAATLLNLIHNDAQ